MLCLLAEPAVLAQEVVGEVVKSDELFFQARFGASGRVFPRQLFVHDLLEGVLEKTLWGEDVDQGAILDHGEPRIRLEKIPADGRIRPLQIEQVDDGGQQIGLRPELLRTVGFDEFGSINDQRDTEPSVRIVALKVGKSMVRCDHEDGVVKVLASLEFFDKLPDCPIRVMQHVEVAPFGVAAMLVLVEGGLQFHKGSMVCTCVHKGKVGGLHLLNLLEQVHECFIIPANPAIPVIWII